MSIDSINELENKVGLLITTLVTAKGDIRDREKKIGSLEEENSVLKKSVEVLKAQIAQYQNQMDAASGKIKSLLTRLETVA